MSSQAQTPGEAPSRPLPYKPRLHGFAVAAMLATFVLLLAGGNVTSKGAGMAVPDWPLSFHSVNPDGWTTNMGGERPGVRDEHGHRLIGATVGLLVTALTVWLATTEHRGWVRLLGFIAFIAVLIQGALGGARVLANSVPMATVHGCFAQAFFGLMVALVAVTSRQWWTDIRQLAKPDASLAPTRSQDTALVWSAGGGVLVIYVQVVLGALLRHTEMNWISHFGWSVVVGLALMAMARYVFAHPYARQTLATPMVALLVLYCVQITLGLSTLLVVYPMWSEATRNPQTLAQIWLPTVHLACGSAILGTATWVAVRAIGIRRGARASLSRRLEGVPA